MQDYEFGSRWIGSDISWCNPCIVANESMSVPSGDVVSSGHYDLDLALKSSIIIVKDGSNPLTKLSKFSKFDKNSSNATVDWLGDRQMTMTQSFWLWSVTSHNTHSEGNGTLIDLKDTFSF